MKNSVSRLLITAVMMTTTLAMLSAGVSACGGSEATETLEIVGSFSDDWGISHSIAETTWVMGDSTFNIAAYSNADDFLVAQNDSSNQYSPDLWSRFDWTESGADIYYCQIVFDAATQAAAETATGAAHNDLETGCGGYGWSKLNPEE